MCQCVRAQGRNVTWLILMCGVLWIGSIQTVPVKVVVAWVLGWVAEREAGIIVDGIFLAGAAGG